ncbi:hypothetical protein ACFYY9_26465 [Streptomyces nigra]|uniref:hypothetical protein n=1 Tax=Streptomyces nigra TaxID=1827580 RepID=UPI00369D64D3
MAQYVILYEHQTLQRVEADSVTHDPDAGVFVFRNSEKKIVAWAREEGVRAVALRSAVDNP